MRLLTLPKLSLTQEQPEESGIGREGFPSFSFRTNRFFGLFVYTTFIVTSAFLMGEETSPISQEKEGREMAPGYPASCCIHVQKPYDIFFSGSFIYWQPIQENMQLGVVSNTTHSADLVNGHVVDLDFTYEPGFKVGLGMNFSDDRWDTFVEYTWFRGTEYARVSLHPDNTNINLLPAWQIPDFLDPYYMFGSEKWELKMDLIDWDLARSYYVGKELCFRPFLGVRCALIRQHVRVNYTNTTPSYLATWPSTHVVQSSHSWGIGPRAGFTSNWKLGRGFRFFGDGEIDILFTQYDWRSTQTSDVSAANRYHVHQNHENSLRTHLALDLGLGWGTYLARNRSYIDFSANYGFQVFFDQNMFRSTFSAQSLGKGLVPNGNLYIHGLEIALRCDF